MGLGSIGIPGLILILIVALLLFGPNKLPELGKAFGKTIREFKKGTKDIFDEEEEQPVKAVKSEGRQAENEGRSGLESSRRLPE